MARIAICILRPCLELLFQADGGVTAIESHSRREFLHDVKRAPLPAIQGAVGRRQRMAVWAQEAQVLGAIVRIVSINVINV